MCGIVKTVTPYADPDKQLEFMRERYRERYADERGFRQKESKRKAKFYAENPAYASRVKRKAQAAARKRVAGSKRS